MLITIMTLLTSSLILLLAAWHFARKRSARETTTYVCDICNAQDCVCRERR